MTAAAFRNALIVTQSIGGSTNALIHLTAVAGRVGIRVDLDEFDALGRISMNDMLVDFAPYLFRGKMGGYLTRLSASGLANVTSGGGQVPAFVVE